METSSATKSVQNKSLLEVIEAVKTATPDQMERLWRLFTKEELQRVQLPSSQTLQETESEAS